MVSASKPAKYLYVGSPLTANPKSFFTRLQNSRGSSVFTSEQSVAARNEWFSMIISYLKVKTLVLWLQLHPESSYEQFENAWPFLLDHMMYKATSATVEQLQILCQVALN